MRSATRRSIMGKLGLGAAAAGLPVTAIAAPADPHPGWLRQVQELRACIDASPDGTPDSVLQPLSDERFAIEDQILETEARTFDGIKAQLALIIHAADEATLGEYEEAGLKVVLAGIERLTGRVA